jgi:uncharacterized protein (DUF433 family)
VPGGSRVLAGTSGYLPGTAKPTESAFGNGRDRRAVRAFAQGRPGIGLLSDTSRDHAATVRHRSSNPGDRPHGRPCYALAVAAFPRVSIDSAVRFGKPCVKGTRITVGEVLGHLASGMPEAELLREFPQLTHEDVLECLAFAAERARRIVIDPAA